MALSLEVTTEPPPDMSERSTTSLRTRARARWDADAGYCHCAGNCRCSYVRAEGSSPFTAGCGTRYEDFTFGTSVATALATRSAHRIHDVLTDGDGGSNHTGIDAANMPLVLKALLVHGAQWGAKGRMLDETFQPQGTGSHFSRRDDIARLLGYGVPNIDRVLDCTENRATLLGVGSIAPESSLLYRVPLPDGLDGVRALRAITITIAWFSPVNPRHHGYRMAAIDVASGSDQKFWIAPQRSFNPLTKRLLAARYFTNDEPARPLQFLLTTATCCYA